jgi:aubergine-like protein
VVFRDGSSDGQESVVVSSEVSQIKQALEGSSIQLVFVLTNKMSSTKFYTTNLENPEPGTIVDSKITEGNDFYLISQKTTQGTVSPTHYKVLYNDLED